MGATRLLGCFREITLREAHGDFGSRRLPGLAARGSGRRAAGVPAGIPEAPRGRPPAQVNVRAKTGCRAAETKTLPGGQGLGGGPRGRSGLWGGWWASGGQVGSEVEVKAGMVWVHRSILQTVGSPRIGILSTY